MKPNTPMTVPPKDTAYSGTPLPKKLGIVTAKGCVSKLAILGEPPDFRALLGDLPSETSIHTRLSPDVPLALCFARSRNDLIALLDTLTLKLPASAHVWIIHPKAHTKPDFNQNDLRDAALSIGLVDYKVCSVSADWSGLKFCWRKSKE